MVFNSFFNMFKYWIVFQLILTSIRNWEINVFPIRCQEATRTIFRIMMECRIDWSFPSIIHWWDHKPLCWLLWTNGELMLLTSNIVLQLIHFIFETNSPFSFIFIGALNIFPFLNLIHYQPVFLFLHYFLIVPFLLLEEVLHLWKIL